MPSPFPGMDPYIESSGRWEDFHAKFIGEIERTLSPLLPARYAISLAERSYVVTATSEGKDEKSFLPDVGVNVPAEGGAPSSRASAAVVADTADEEETFPIRAFVATEHREAFIEIYDILEGQSLVTGIEVLSPSNKRRGTTGWNLYQRKREAMLLGEAHFVEMDLVREGGRLPMVDPWPASPYAILVVRRERAPAGRGWAVDYRRSLPEIPIPLESPDAPVRFALQPIFDAVYDRSRYAARIDYTKPLTPPLAAEDAAWLEARLPTSAAPPKRKPAKRRRRS
jgi:hypothetical protein